MLKRHPTTTSFKWSQVFKGVLYVEAVIFLGSFYLFKKLSRDQNFRHNYYENHGIILEIGHDYYRELDYKQWNIPYEKKKKN